MKKNIKIWIAIAIIAIIVIVLPAGFFLALTALMSNEESGTDISGFEAEYSSYFGIPVPPSATEFNFYKDDIKLRKSGVCSFVLPQSEFDAYQKDVIERYKVDTQDEGNLSYGYGHWYGMRVCDINADNPDYVLDEVPEAIHFEKVIKDDIGEYTVLLYSPSGTGTRSFGIFVNNSSRRVVCYYNATIR